MKRFLSDRFLICIAIVLVIPFTFYWSTSEYYGYGGILFGVDAISRASGYVTSDLITTFSVASYLSLFFALFIRKSRGLQASLITLSFIFHLLMISQYSLYLSTGGVRFLDMLRNLFVNIPDRFPFQALLTIALIPWVMLLVRQFEHLRQSVRTFFSGLASSSRVLSVFTIVLWFLASIFLLIFGVTQYLDVAKGFDSGFQLSLLLAAIALLLKTVLFILIVAIVAVAFVLTVPKWKSEIAELNERLKDFRLNHYVTRLISGYLYWIYFTLIVTIMAVVTPMQTLISYESQRLNSGLQPGTFLVLIVGPLIGALLGYLIILALRLVFELLVALVHIAQNTRSRNQLT